LWQSNTPILELRDVSKSFGGNKALTNVNIQAHPGEVICLLGDNGAGKSTLIKILSGVHQPTTGTVLLDGKEVHFGDARHAMKNGIATVHQEVGSIPLMTVGRNFFLGAELTKGWGVFRRFDTARANELALEQIRRLGITRVKNGDQLVGTLSGGERQALSIGRALYFGARVLILDEPTSALGVNESEIVLRLIRQAKADGLAVILITHNATHALAVGDRFVILIHGSVAAEFQRGEKSREEVLNLMAGGEALESLEARLDADDAA
jgi:simple sugar transport system ATP-binding protein